MMTTISSLEPQGLRERQANAASTPLYTVYPESPDGSSLMPLNLAAHTHLRAFTCVSDYQRQQHATGQNQARQRYRVVNSQCTSHSALWCTPMHCGVPGGVAE